MFEPVMPTGFKIISFAKAMDKIFSSSLEKLVFLMLAWNSDPKGLVDSKYVSREEIATASSLTEVRLTGILQLLEDNDLIAIMPDESIQLKDY